jgi:hypothetical protein
MFNNLGGGRRGKWGTKSTTPEIRAMVSMPRQLPHVLAELPVDAVR